MNKISTSCSEISHGDSTDDFFERALENLMVT